MLVYDSSLNIPVVRMPCRGLDMTSIADLHELQSRFDAASELILKHPSFSDEAREKAAEHSVKYMESLAAIIEASGGVLPEDSQIALEAVIGFLDLVEDHCSNSDEQ